MFIRAANSRTGSGYAGDVNISFREGRQDAFRDYIDNFNFALKADVANNAENQRQVERVSKNYGLNLDMDQATRQDAYDFFTKSSAIDNAKTQMGIDFQKNSHLKDPTAQAELGQAKAAKFAADIQSGAVKANYDLADWNFRQEQQPVTQQATANNNQADLTKSETNKVTASIGNDGAINQQELIKIANGLKQEEVEQFYIKRMNEKDPDHGMTLEQLKAEAQANAAELRMEYAKIIAAKNVAAIRFAGGNIDGNVYSFDPRAKGNQTKVTGGNKSSTKNSTEDPKPTVSKLGKTSVMTQAEFNKQKGSMVAVDGYDSVFLLGNTVVVKNKAGSYNTYAPNELTIGKNKQPETRSDLIARALAESGRTADTAKTKEQKDPESQR